MGTVECQPIVVRTRTFSARTVLRRNRNIVDILPWKTPFWKIKQKRSGFPRGEITPSGLTVGDCKLREKCQAHPQRGLCNKSDNEEAWESQASKEQKNELEEFFGHQRCREKYVLVQQVIVERAISQGRTSRSREQARLSHRWRTWGH